MNIPPDKENLMTTRTSLNLMTRYRYKLQTRDQRKPLIAANLLTDISHRRVVANPDAEDGDKRIRL